MKDEKLVKGIASERIERLFELAEKRLEEGKESSEALSKRYIGLARRISTHYKVRMPESIRNRICKSCNSVLIAGLSATVRKSSHGYMVYRCGCGAQKKVFLKKGAAMNTATSEKLYVLD